MKVFKAVVGAIFPARCVSCGEILDDESYLCYYCAAKIERTDFSKICMRCGREKDDCECKNRVFHFSRCVAPFENQGVAQAAVYRFKFKRVSAASKFFAREMLKTIKIVYGDISFDSVAYVPMHPIKQMRRGFNQSEQLARYIARKLGVKFSDRLLSCKYRRKSQHDMQLKERFKNVKGMYSFNYKVKGKTVLLVDDIKTTGASLDECARQLLLAGANDVYCITAVASKSKKGIK